MPSNTKMPAPASAISLPAAQLALVSTVAFVVLLAILHVVKSDLDPSWRVISEYAIGSNGWMMVAAFLALAAACVGLFAALKSQIRNIYGRIGLALLLITAVGMAMAGVFVTDPITASADDATTAGMLHEIGAFLDLTPFAAILVSLSLIRKNPAWAKAKKALKWTMFLPLVGLVVFIGATAAEMPKDGISTPDVLIGWPNRFLILTYCVWFATVAWQAIKLRGNKA